MRKRLTTTRRHWLILLLGLFLTWNFSAAQQSASTPSGVVAIGDIHGDSQALRKTFRAAGATNARGVWIGGGLTVVQLGDLIGRRDVGHTEHEQITPRCGSRVGA